ncbi:hypothetical protein APHAL10511_006959 [Amanita phalloides]|nr:hypothetical protein APHAL10511_006959 [Amanita phalloides]
MAPAGGRHTSSIAQRIPSGIIYEILQYFSAPLLTGQLDHFPWYLAHICSSWRIEFMSMRRNFWNEITIYLTRKEQGRTLDVLDMFLECNLGYPFSFELDVHRNASKSYVTPIFDRIISESARWRRVTLRLDLGDMSPLYHLKGKLEHLESLEFFLEDNSVDYIPEAFTDLFMSAPYLTRMHMYPLSTWNFNWPIVTVMHLELVQREEVARLPLILSQAMQMETLSIHKHFQSGKDLPFHGLVTLPNLTALDTDCFYLLQNMIIPSLKELRLSVGWDGTGPYRAGAQVMKSFISRSQCRIQTLALECLDIESAIEILSHTPDIRVLYMGMIAGMIDIFGWLNEMHRVETPKLTRLQSLTMYNSSLPPGENALDEIFDFIAWRRIRIENAGSIVEKLQKFGFGGYWDSEGEAHEVDEDDEVDEDVDREVQVRLRKLCELHGIQFSVRMDRFEINGIHDRSSDPYVYSSFFSEDLYESSDEYSGTMPVFE